jgi:outer membrane protein
LRNRIVRDVRAAWLNANTAYNRLAVSQQFLQQANQALDLSQTRYQLGLGSMVELNQANSSKPRHKSATCRPGYDYRLALAALRYQTSAP